MARPSTYKDLKPTFWQRVRIFFWPSCSGCNRMAIRQASNGKYCGKCGYHPRRRPVFDMDHPVMYHVDFAFDFNNRLEELKGGSNG